jgi:hypothetical protein
VAARIARFSIALLARSDDCRRDRAQPGRLGGLLRARVHLHRARVAGAVGCLAAAARLWLTTSRLGVIVESCLRARRSRGLRRAGAEDEGVLRDGAGALEYPGAKGCG